MKFICKYCNKEIEFENSKQKGSHLGNCLSNPKRIEALKIIREFFNKSYERS